MNTIRNFLLALSAMMMMWAPQGHAEDIDIYSGNPNSGVPNILFVMDTGANFSSNAAVPCTAYAAGGAPSLGGTAGGVEQCAMVDTILALPDGAVNIGIMVNNNNNFANDTRAATDAAYHETCAGTYGGCLVRKLTLMSAANKASLVNFIKSWTSSGGNSATVFNVKSGGDRTANAMQEAWAYYNGKIGMSGKNYGTSLLDTGCQKNFIIYIGNALNVSGTPGDGGAESPFNGANALTSLQVAATAAQKVKISETVTFKANPTCGVASIAASTNASNWSENWADEWARLMYNQDGSANGQGTQNIITYTVGVINNGGCKPDYPALLSTMAKYGGGSYFQTSNADEVKAALTQILNEIQAVNSVFASASLPISTTSQGTFENQIFLGMFRPDASANPRWLGNLKQYQLVKTAGGAFVLGDKDGNPAISSAGTGFISSTATSIWTTKASAEPEVSGGFYKNDLRGTPPHAYDLPDGEMVEKGGAAQQTRLESLTANFSATAGSSTNPRRLYTYCPSGVSCEGRLVHASNAFGIENAGISASAFGASTAAKINSITRIGTAAEVVTAGNHGFTLGTTSVVIGNVTDPTAYNGTFTVQACAVNVPTCFKITGLGDYPNTPSVNAYTFATPGGAGVSVTSMTRTTNGTNASASGLNKETVSVTTAGHTFTAGATVNISGASPAAYNGNQVIALPNAGACLSPTCFTYEIAVTPNSPALNTYAAVVTASGASRNVVGVIDTGTGGTATVTTTAAHGFHVGQVIRFTGTSNSRYDYTASPSGTNTGTDFVVASITGVAATSTIFTFTGYSGNPANVGTLGQVLPSTVGIPVVPSRAAGTATVTITATGATANRFGNALNATKKLDIVQTGGTSTSEAAYVAGGVTVTCTTSNCSSFTYGPVATAPSSTITGTIIAALPGAASATIPVGNITRVGTAATATGVTANLFGSGAAGAKTGTTSTLNVSVASGSNTNESAYLGNGTWTITCSNATCTSFTFGPVTQTPTLTASGSNMQAYAAGTAPPKDPLIQWVRGQDNYGDELGPGLLNSGSSATIRPSLHGDVLHSRPVVVNYGNTDSSKGPVDPRGVVVFYGGNDGVFRAVNGSKTQSIGSIPPGGELWGLILPEHYGALGRQRTNAPELKLANTLLDSARPKDYFVDGATGFRQTRLSDGITSDKAYLYLVMRRGGRFMYALDVSTPTDPIVIWKKSFSDLGMDELGQTWSRPRIANVNGYANPVLIFGAGYSPAQDSEPPTANTMGRGIFVIDALDGSLVWKAVYGASSACASAAPFGCTVPEMVYAIPSDVAILDRSLDKKVDRAYVGDLGGNLWRLDFVTSSDGTLANASSAIANWRVTKIAALGCATGVCADGTTPRKFFFPPSILSIGDSGGSGSYEAVLLGSGDREHPLTSTAAGSSHLVQNRFYMIKDTVTSATPTRSTTNLAAIAGVTLRTEATLFKAFNSYSISGFVRSANTMTVTTSAPHTFAVGDFVVIDKAIPATLDGQYQVAAKSSTTFSYVSIGSDASVAAASPFPQATGSVAFTGLNTEPGFHTYLATGEKSVNAPLTTSGTTFFGTNRPYAPDVNTCSSNLGEARGYAIDPFSGSATSVVYDGGGLPPTAVTGIVTVYNADGTVSKTRFCIGCGGASGGGAGGGGGGGGGGGNDGSGSVLDNFDPSKPVAKKPTRTYWYKK